ncbi:MAG: hypothetical protein IPI10_15250 [Bacteroidetes bacterium]|nr:hypothetical protein [Bacteroidota bacterium]
MENLENKLIADKINSLDTLPDGYVPNLEAKWALLQSKEKNEKISFLWGRKTWMKIAACLLILLLSGIVWISKTSQPKSEIANSTSPSKPSLPKVEKVVNSSEKFATITSENKSIDKSKNKSRSTIVTNEVPVKEVLHTDKEEIVLNPPTIDTIITLQEVNLASVENSKLKKARYTQLDFEDAILQPATKTTFAQSFQFRLGLKSSNYSEQNSNENSVLKLKRNF